MGYIGNNKARLKELMALFQSGNYRLGQRAAWPLSYILKAIPELIADYFKVMFNPYLSYFLPS